MPVTAIVGRVRGLRPTNVQDGLFAQNDLVLLILVVFLIVVGRSIRCDTGSSRMGMQAVLPVADRVPSSPGTVREKGRKPVNKPLHVVFMLILQAQIAP